MSGADICEFIEARLAEDAKRWQTIWLFQHAGRKAVDGWWDLGGTFGYAVNDIIDTTRGGREVAAKRRILERHRNFDFPPDEDDGPGDYAWTPRCDHCFKPWPCPELLDIAAIYADHEDYAPKWSATP